MFCTKTYDLLPINLYNVILFIRIGSYRIVCLLQTYPTCSEQIVYGLLTNQLVRVGKCQLVADFESFLQKAGKQTLNKFEVGCVGANEIEM
jgi:hypothetical protein